MIFSVFCVLALLVSSSTSYPKHAQCQIEWQLPIGCDEVREGLVSQMKLWETNDCPKTSIACPELPCGQKCLYKYLDTDDSGTVTATHTTPVKKFVDDLAFTFTGDQTKCTIDAASSSQLSFAYLDFGTNYCNLKNLLDGSGLSLAEGFVEKTSTDICTQYDKLNCDKY